MIAAEGRNIVDDLGKLFRQYATKIYPLNHKPRQQDS